MGYTSKYAQEQMSKVVKSSIGELKDDRFRKKKPTKTESKTLVLNIKK